MTWPTKKLGEVAKIEGGGTPSTKNPIFWNGDVPWLTPKELSDFSDSEIFDTERKITKEGLSRSSTKLFPAGTVLFTSRAPIGYIVIAGIEMATNQGFKNFICNEKILDNRFLYYFLKLRTKYLQSLGRGATFTEISKSILAKVDIPIPPPEIQKQIVERLDEIAEAQKLNDELVQKSDELFQSLLHKELDPAGKNWEVKRLEEICEIARGGSPRPINKYLTNSPKGINWIKIGDVKEGEMYVTSTKQKIKPEGVLKTRLVKEGDFILSNSMSFGRPYIMKISGAIHDGWLLLRLKNTHISTDFLYHILGSSQTQIQFEKSASGGVVRNLNSNLVRKIKIIVPPTKTQKQIVVKLSAVQDYKTKLLAQKSKFKELFDSVLAESFNN